MKWTKQRVIKANGNVKWKYYNEIEASQTRKLNCNVIKWTTKQKIEVSFAAQFVSEVK